MIASNIGTVIKVALGLFAVVHLQSCLMASSIDNSLKVSVTVEGLAYTVIIENQSEKSVKIPDPFYSPLSQNEVPVGARILVDDVSNGEGVFLSDPDDQPFSSLFMISDTDQSKTPYVSIAGGEMLKGSFSAEDLWRGLIIKNASSLQESGVSFRFQISFVLEVEKKPKHVIQAQSEWVDLAEALKGL